MRQLQCASSDILSPPQDSPQSDAYSYTTFFLLLKSAVGAGILALPSVFTQLGWLLAIHFLLAAALLTLLNCRYLLEAMDRTGKQDYKQLIRQSWESERIGDAVGLVIILNNFGICISQIQIFGTGCEGLLSELMRLQRWQFSLLLFLLTPFLLSKKINFYRLLSLIGSLSIMFFVLLTLLDSVSSQGGEGIQTVTGKSWTQKFKTMPNILLAFNMQINLVSIFRESSAKSQRKRDITLLLVISVVFFIYLASGLSGYLSYGIKNLSKQGRPIQNFLQIVNAFGSNRVSGRLMDICFVFNSFLTLPLFFFDARNNLLNLLQKNFQFQTQQYFRPASFFIFLLIFIISLTISNLSVVFNFLGSITSNLIGYILPWLILQSWHPQMTLLKRIGGWLSTSLAVLVMLQGIVKMIVNK